ncbi:polysaccharide biosynthesis/export family protein [Limimaricola sp. AA108-03]|uniref:polysaccharide biosynthesis/export family protein n=1 Tax=Limimaricola sp. AA108-03 TaxID=3425945 RepID=UPI003D77485A
MIRLTLPGPARLAAIMLAVALVGAPLQAAPYRLIAGDRIEIAHAGMEAPVQLTVDTDGQVRLAEIGGIDVIGLTLDEVEAEIAARVGAAGLYVDARVNVVVADYAPVVVTGDVAAPGRYDYLPGMTVAVALATSGGSETLGLSQLDLARARADAKSLLETLNLDIAGAAARLARLEAALGEAPLETLTPEAVRGQVPSPGAAPLQALVETERALLRAERERAEMLMTSWEEEIRTIEAQKQLFDERILLQEEIVANTAEALRNARELQERGLQTTASLSSAEERASDAQARALELETAQIAATRAISDARRARAQFLADRERTNLADLQAGRIEIDGLRLRHARALEQLALLSGGGAGALLDATTVELGYRLLSPRPGRDEITEIDAQTPLLPGDTLIVTVTSRPLDIPS